MFVPNSSHLIYPARHIHLYYFLCVTFIVILFWFKFHFTHNIHCFLECFGILIVLNRILNGEIMYQLPIFSSVWSSHEKNRLPCFRGIFLIFSCFICIIHLIKSIKFLICFDKNIQNVFSSLNFHCALLFFKPLLVLLKSLCILLPSIHNYRKISC